MPILQCRLDCGDEVVPRRLRHAPCMAFGRQGSRRRLRSTPSRMIWWPRTHSGLACGCGLHSSASPRPCARPTDAEPRASSAISALRVYDHSGPKSHFKPASPSRLPARTSRSALSRHVLGTYGARHVSRQRSAPRNSAPQPSSALRALVASGGRAAAGRSATAESGPSTPVRTSTLRPPAYVACATSTGRLRSCFPGKRRWFVPHQRRPPGSGAALDPGAPAAP